jgi:hypothetical protein
MKNWLIIIRLWLDWRKRVSGRAVIDWRRGPGYYLPGQIFGYRRDIGRIETVDMTSGDRGVFKLLEIDLFVDPSDMIKESRWQLLGYEGQKPFSKMSFREFFAARSKHGAAVNSRQQR